MRILRTGTSLTSKLSLSCPSKKALKMNGRKKNQQKNQHKCLRPALARPAVLKRLVQIFFDPNAIVYPKVFSSMFSHKSINLYASSLLQNFTSNLLQFQRTISQIQKNVAKHRNQSLAKKGKRELEKGKRKSLRGL